MSLSSFPVLKKALEWTKGMDVISMTGFVGLISSDRPCRRVQFGSQPVEVEGEDQ